MQFPAKKLVLECFYRVWQKITCQLLKSPESDLRIQVQTDPCYQAFIIKAIIKNVRGYDMKVAAIEDILPGKFGHILTRKDERVNVKIDLADIFLLVEAYPDLHDLLPDSIKSLEM